MEPEQLLFALVFVIGMFTGVFIIFLGTRQRAQPWKCSTGSGWR